MLQVLQHDMNPGETMFSVIIKMALVGFLFPYPVQAKECRTDLLPSILEGDMI